MNRFRLAATVRKRIFRQPSTVEQLSERRWTLCDAEEALAPKAIFSPGVLDRITGVMADTTIEQERRRIDGGPVVHGATRAFELAQVDLVDGALYRKGLHFPLVRPQKRVAPPSRQRVAVDQAVLASSLYGSVYFGHWITDDMTLHLAAESIGQPATIEHRPFGHEAGYCTLLDINRTCFGAAHFDKLIMLDDTGENSFKRRRYQELRARMARHVGPAASELVYIRRGTTGAGSARHLANVQDLERYLVAQGFSVLDPDRMSAEQMSRGVLGARVVLGVEGSHLLHSIYGIRDGGCICVIQPPDRFNNVIKNYADCLGLHYAFTVATPAPTGFDLPLEDLQTLLDLAMRRAA